MDFEDIAKTLQEAPLPTSGTKPEVWCRVEVTEAAKEKNPFDEYDDINFTLRIVGSAVDANGNKAFGFVWDRFSMPPKGHNMYWKTQKAKDALGILLAPALPRKERFDAAVVIAREAGGFESVIVGKTALVQLRTNDGTDRKTGEIKSPARHEKPRTEIGSWMPDTPDNCQKQGIVADDAAAPF